MGTETPVFGALLDHPLSLFICVFYHIIYYITNWYTYVSVSLSSAGHKSKLLNLRWGSLEPPTCCSQIRRKSE